MRKLQDTNSVLYIMYYSISCLLLTAEGGSIKLVAPNLGHIKDEVEIP